MQIKPGRGRKRSARTNNNIQRVREIVQNLRPGQTISSRMLSRTTTIRRTSLRRIVKYDLNLKFFKKVYCQKLTPNVKQKRLQRCQQLLGRFRSREQIRKIWFTDEKLFTLRQPKNSQNNRVYANVARKREVPLEHLLVPREHFTQSVMVSLGVSISGKTRIYFVENKINSEIYQRDILSYMLPEIEDVTPYYTFQQDGAPAHTSRDTIRYLQENCPDFIEPAGWPPNSPDLNPVDYTIWGVLQHMVYLNTIFETTDQLKIRILECWQEFQQDIINNSIAQWRRRVQDVVDNEGGHIHRNFL